MKLFVSGLRSLLADRLSSVVIIMLLFIISCTSHILTVSASRRFSMRVPIGQGCSSRNTTRLLRLSTQPFLYLNSKFG